MAQATYKLDALRPIARPRKLSQQIAERIAGEIQRRRLSPGSRLPTEQELAAAMGVSRTVVREAVAALRSQGLVITRQGVGAFVAQEVTETPFRLIEGGLPSLQAVLEVMELRAGVEVLAAGLAASRANPAGKRAIGKALAGIDTAIRKGQSAIQQDFEFHSAIAEATGNPQFGRFLVFLGQYIIPRQSVRLGTMGGSAERDYLETIQDEHRAIHAAIVAGDSSRARDAMRAHLERSRERYRESAAQELPGAK